MARCWSGCFLAVMYCYLVAGNRSGTHSYLVAGNHSGTHNYLAVGNRNSVYESSMGDLCYLGIENPVAASSDYRRKKASYHC